MLKKFPLKLIVLQLLAQLFVQSMLVLVLSVVNELENAAALGEIVGEVQVLEDSVLVEALERDHNIQQAKPKALQELVIFLGQIWYGGARDIALVVHGSSAICGSIIVKWLGLAEAAAEVRPVSARL